MFHTAPRERLDRPQWIEDDGSWPLSFRCFGEYVTITASTRKSGVSTELRARSLNTACLCAKAAEDLRGKETLVLDLTEVTPIVDYFVITTGASGRQMRSVAEEVDRVMRAHGSRPRGIEGHNDVSWILHDFGDIVLHVF